MALVVTVAAVGRSAARKSRRGSQARGASSVALLGPLAGSWLALGIVDSIAGALGGLVSKPVDWARSMIQGVVSWITDWVNHVIDWAGHAFDSLWGVFGTLSGWAHEVGNWIGAEWDRVSRWIGSAVGRTADWVAGRIGDTVNWAFNELNKVYTWAQRLVDDSWRWAFDNVIAPIRDTATALAHDLWNTVVPWVKRIVDDLQGWAVSGFDHLWGWLRAEVQPFIGWAIGLLHGVEKAWGWIVWVGEHPIDWVRALWRAWIGMDGRNATAAMVDALTRESDLVADHLVRWLG